MSYWRLDQCGQIAHQEMPKEMYATEGVHQYSDEGLLGPHVTHRGWRTLLPNCCVATGDNDFVKVSRPLSSMLILSWESGLVDFQICGLQARLCCY